ncbi:AT132 ATPase, partial [Atractosteus spatula]|nr:AT132 ATPase [Atractosteus spatula]
MQDVQGYRRVQWRVLLCHLGAVLSAGLLLVLFHWRPRLGVWARCQPCPLSQAELLLIKDSHGQRSLVDVISEELEEGSLEQPGAEPEEPDWRDTVQLHKEEKPVLRYYIFEGLRYVWLARKGAFCRPINFRFYSDSMKFLLFLGLLGNRAAQLTAATLEGRVEQSSGLRPCDRSRPVLLMYDSNKCSDGTVQVLSSPLPSLSLSPVLDKGLTCSELQRRRRGLSREEQRARRKVYGQNLIDVPVKSYLRLLLEEVLNPFYIFQIFSVVLWISDNYYYYAICIILISLVSIAVSLYEIRKQSVTLRRMAQLVVSVLVHRASGEEESVNSLDLVPGDCILIPPEGLLLPCDAALLEGECMVNESMLTGESVPVMKTALLKGTALYSPDAHQRHTLFCGTQVIQAKGASQVNAIAVVTRTGFFTAKGDLVSSIMYPQPINFRFYSDSMKFLLFLGLLAAVGTVYSLVILGRSGVSWSMMLIRALDIVTIIVPAALPAAMTTGTIYSQSRLKKQGVFCISPPRINVSGKVTAVCFDKVSWSMMLIRALDIVTIIVPAALPAAMTTGTIYSQSRLKKQGVFCISPPRINVSGKVTAVCFDKTGTLTQEGLDVWGVLPRAAGGPGELVPDPRLLPAGPLLTALACCHSACLLGGQPVGDPLDLKMIESTGWELQEPEEEASKLFGGVRVLAVMRPPAPELQPQGITPSRPLAILRRFPFSSALQRMGVVIRATGETAALAFLKGAPEMVASLCRRDSVPASFSMTLHQFASDGFRVLGLAYKSLTQRSQEELEDMSRSARVAPLFCVQREAVESDMQFLGFLVMRNLVKPETAPVISTLRQASIRTIMATGDNILTAVNVARGCGMVAPGERVIFVHGAPPLGHSPPTLRFLLAESGLRTAPRFLLQSQYYCVAMCGDGANDCGALRAADVGVSLSEAEASVASPFTSHTDDITCIPLLIREGRCSLVTSFGLFKYMALYSLIQFSSVLILYTVKTNLGDLQFLFFDLVLVTSLAIVMGRSGPADQLCAHRPPASLLAAPVLGSLLLHTLLLVLIQISTLFITEAQDWFVPLNDTVVGAGNLPNFENTGLFGVTGYQYLIMAIVLSKGHPFRKPLYTNVLFMLVLAVLCAVMSWLVLYPLHGLRQLLSLQQVDDMNYKLLLVALSALNFFCALMLEQTRTHTATDTERDTSAHTQTVFPVTALPQKCGVKMRASCLLLISLPALLLAQQYEVTEDLYPNQPQYPVEDYDVDYQEAFQQQVLLGPDSQQLLPVTTGELSETEPTEPGPLDCREEQYPCTRLYSVHKPCRQCLKSLCFYSLRRVYVVNKEVCVRTVCAHDELLRADLCRDHFTKCGVMALNGQCSSLGETCAKSCGAC